MFVGFYMVLSVCAMKIKSPQTRTIARFTGYYAGAGNGIRTRDIQLGKLTLYH
jgi:hypothetical protein